MKAFQYKQRKVHFFILLLNFPATIELSWWRRCQVLSATRWWDPCYRSKWPCMCMGHTFLSHDPYSVRDSVWTAESSVYPSQHVKSLIIFSQWKAICHLYQHSAQSLDIKCPTWAGMAYASCGKANSERSPLLFLPMKMLKPEHCSPGDSYMRSWEQAVSSQSIVHAFSLTDFTGASSLDSNGSLNVSPNPASIVLLTPNPQGPSLQHPWCSSLTNALKGASLQSEPSGHTLL